MNNVLKILIYLITQFFFRIFKYFDRRFLRRVDYI